MTLRLGDHCGMHLADLAENDPGIWVLDGDLADSDGAIHFATRHPDRFLMAGIAEQGMVSTAAGMASCGLRPWVFSFAAFLCYRAYDQIRVNLCQTGEPVALVGSHSGGCSGRNGRTHAAMNDIALMASLPGMAVWAPADAADARFAIDEVTASSGPAYLRLPRVPVPGLPGEPSPCRWLQRWEDVVIVSTGFATHHASAVREELARAGGVVGHIHCARIAPLPVEELHEMLGKATQIYVIEDHYRFGGLASLIQMMGLGGSVRSLGWPDGWPGKSGSDRELLESQGIGAAQLAEIIRAGMTGRSVHVPVHVFNALQ